MPKQGKTPKKKSKEKTPQKSGESEYPAMEQEELNRLVQNAIEQSQAQLQQKHEEQIKRLEADREALEERLTKKFKDEVHELNRAFDDGVKSARSIPLFIDNQACLSVTNHPNNSTKSRHIALREFRIRDYHELGMIRPYWCPGNYNVADFFSKLLEKA